MNILVIVAHPDDEVLGAGGIMLKHAEKGDKVSVLYMATGITSRRKSNYQNISAYESKQNESDKMKQEIEMLRNDAKKACKLLGVKNTIFYDYPDNEMDSVPLLQIVKTIEKEIIKNKPDKIFTHHYGDLNIDHRIVYNATLTACRPFGNIINEIICFEVTSSTEWNYPASFNPNYFVDIHKQLEKKIKAMESYRNEIRQFPHPRSAKNLKSIAEKWGATSGNKAAEAFEIIRKIEK
jgi:LmbE family N-acetylglucosaminyl deacetylase